MGRLIKINYITEDEIKCVAEFRSESLYARCKHIIKKDAYESQVQLEVNNFHVEEKASTINDCTS